MSASNPAAGQKFGRLTVMDEAVTRKGGNLYFKVKCECGTIKIVSKSNLNSLRVNSCGCLNSEVVRARATTHGKRHAPIYAVWNMMKQRCNLPTNKQYKDYGGRGIKVCERWQAFENFYADVGDPPFHRATLERVDNEKDYEPSNVRWATYSEQARNNSKTVVYGYNGARLTLAAIASKAGVNINTLTNRIYGYGMTLEDALSGKSPASLGYDRVMARKAGDKLYPKDAA